MANSYVVTFEVTDGAGDVATHAIQVDAYNATDAMTQAAVELTASGVTAAETRLLSIKPDLEKASHAARQFAEAVKDSLIRVPSRKQ